MHGLRIQADTLTLSPAILVIATPRPGTYEDGSGS